MEIGNVFSDRYADDLGPHRLDYLIDFSDAGELAVLRNWLMEAGVDSESYDALSVVQMDWLFLPLQRCHPDLVKKILSIAFESDVEVRADVVGSVMRSAVLRGEIEHK